MFKKITYYGVVGALYDESPVDLPDGTFECPIRLDSSPKHNVLVVLDVTTQNLVPEPETEFFCGVIWPTLPNSMDILQQFETNVHRQFDGFRTLLSRLVILRRNRSPCRSVTTCPGPVLRPFNSPCAYYWCLLTCRPWSSLTSCWIANKEECCFRTWVPFIATKTSKSSSATFAEIPFKSRATSNTPSHLLATTVAFVVSVVE